MRVYSFSIEERERECVCVFIDVIYSTRTTITTTAYPPNHRVTLVITSVNFRKITNLWKKTPSRARLLID